MSADQSLNQRLGGVLRRLRQSADKGLKDIAAAAGISVAYLSDIETGKACPPIPTLFAIADALGTAPSRILAEIEAEKTPTHRIQFSDVFDCPGFYDCIDDGQTCGGQPRVLLLEDVTIPWAERTWEAGERMIVHRRFLHPVEVKS